MGTLRVCDQTAELFPNPVLFQLRCRNDLCLPDYHA